MQRFESASFAPKSKGWYGLCSCAGCEESAVSMRKVNRRASWAYCQRHAQRVLQISTAGVRASKFSSNAVSGRLSSKGQGPAADMYSMSNATQTVSTLEAQILEVLKDRAGDVAAISIRIGDLSISDSRIQRAAKKLVDRGTLERIEYTETESRMWGQAGKLQRRRVEYRRI